MSLSEVANIGHGTSLLIIGGVILITLIVIFILAKYLFSDSPDKNLDD